MIYNIEFPEKEVNITSNMTEVIDNVNVMFVEDTGTKIVASFRIALLSFKRDLWTGGAYKPLSEWTESEINSRIIQVI